jgi:hypothetical protein
VETGSMKKNCLTDFYRSDIRALRVIDFLLFGLLLEQNDYLFINKPG